MRVIVLQHLLLDFFSDLIFFPLWWYSEGAKNAFFFLVELFEAANGRLAPGLWLRYITVPMFGQYDWQGRMVSFFVRSANVIIRGALLLLFAFALSCLFLLWLIAPIAVMYLFFISWK